VRGVWADQGQNGEERCETGTLFQRVDEQAQQAGEAVSWVQGIYREIRWVQSHDMRKLQAPVLLDVFIGIHGHAFQ